MDVLAGERDVDHWLMPVREPLEELVRCPPAGHHGQHRPNAVGTRGTGNGGLRHAH